MHRQSATNVGGGAHALASPSAIRRLIERWSRKSGRFLARIWREADKDSLPNKAAAVAFYGFLAVIPTLATLVLFYGLIFDSSDVARQLDLLAEVAPKEVVSVLSVEAMRLANTDASALGLGALGGLLVALWSSTQGARAMISAINAVHDGTEQRGRVRLYALSLAYTAAGVLAVGVALALMVSLPLLERYLPGRLDSSLVLARWGLAFAVVLVAIGALFRFAPTDHTCRRWVSAGSITATLFWLAASFGFQLYVERIASLSASFGSLSTVAIFLLWLYFSVLVILIGAEIDSMRRRDAEGRRPATTGTGGSSSG